MLYLKKTCKYELASIYATHFFKTFLKVLKKNGFSTDEVTRVNFYYGSNNILTLNAAAPDPYDRKWEIFTQYRVKISPYVAEVLLLKIYSRFGFELIKGHTQEIVDGEEFLNGTILERKDW